MPKEGIGRYRDRDNELILRRSAVLFVDLLGVSKMTTGPEAQDNLKIFANALDEVFEVIDEASDYLPNSTFSDSILVASPLDESLEEQVDGLRDLVFTAAEIQITFARLGIFVRGGITIDEICVDGTRVFGAGLVNAYDIERKEAVVPRIMFSRTCAPLEALLQSEELDGLVLTDHDGSQFVDYLHYGIEHMSLEPGDGGEFLTTVERHVTDIGEALDQHRATASQWEKYRWCAEYVNYFSEVVGPEYGLDIPKIEDQELHVRQFDPDGHRAG